MYLEIWCVIWLCLIVGSCVIGFCWWLSFVFIGVGLRWCLGGRVFWCVFICWLVGSVLYSWCGWSGLIMIMIWILVLDLFVCLILRGVVVCFVCIWCYCFCWWLWILLFCVVMMIVKVVVMVLGCICFCLLLERCWLFMMSFGELWIWWWLVWWLLVSWYCCLCWVIYDVWWRFGLLCWVCWKKFVVICNFMVWVVFRSGIIIFLSMMWRNVLWWRFCMNCLLVLVWWWCWCVRVWVVRMVGF